MVLRNSWCSEGLFQFYPVQWALLSLWGIYWWRDRHKFLCWEQALEKPMEEDNQVRKQRGTECCTGGVRKKQRLEKKNCCRKKMVNQIWLNSISGIWKCGQETNRGHKQNFYNAGEWGWVNELKLYFLRLEQTLFHMLHGRLLLIFYNVSLLFTELHSFLRNVPLLVCCALKT